MIQELSGFGGLFFARRLVIVGANGAGKTFWPNGWDLIYNCS